MQFQVCKKLKLLKHEFKGLNCNVIGGVLDNCQHQLDPHP